MIKSKLTHFLSELICDDMNIYDDIGFFDMGLSSLTIFTFCEKIRVYFKIDLDESIIFDYPNISELAAYIKSKI